ncbi:MAG: Gfo/Idh/MocA family oxidoreductase [Clostridia bacterium]|nr:Gfo/Idh/MocA family oxidoreductase [Clostridia bacterium]
MDKLKSAVVGCGSVSSQHFNTIDKNEKSELVAVCDIIPEKADKKAAEYGATAFYDFDEMLEKAQFDVLHICTPHYLHAEMAIKAMNKGINVLCEKPLAIFYADALKMCECAEKNNVYLGTCFQNRYNDASVYIKNLLSSGEMGAVTGAKGMVTWDRDEEYYSDDWHGTLAKEGGGVVINQSIHTLDLLQWLIGSDMVDIRSSISQKRLAGKVETEDTADALITFENGVQALFYATLCYNGNSPVFIELLCEKGKIVMYDDLAIIKKGEDKHTVTFEHGKGEKGYWGNSHGKLIAEFYDSIINKTHFEVDGRSGIKAVKIVDSLYSYARKI